MQQNENITENNTPEIKPSKRIGLKILLWTIAVLLTCFSLFYQRISGPTYPKRVKAQLAGKDYSFKLLRTSDAKGDCLIPIIIPDTSVKGFYYFRKFPTKVDYTKQTLERKKDTLFLTVPHQPPAGKIQYYLELTKEGQSVMIQDKDPVIIRYKGHVPTWIVIIHVLAMFVGMLFAIIAGLFAFAKINSFKFYTKLTLIVLIIGGFVLGPIVQKYAFGDLWTGIPFGWDLTDNKTLIGIVIWIVAYWKNRQEPNRAWTIAATVVLFIVYSIPHSLFGSTLNHSTGKIGQGALPIIPVLLYFFEKFKTKCTKWRKRN